MEMTIETVAQLAIQVGLEIKFDTVSKAWFYKDRNHTNGTWHPDYSGIANLIDKVIAKKMEAQLSRDEFTYLQRGTGLLPEPEPTDAADSQGEV